MTDPRSQTISVLMVCMGNICRSPTAEGVLRHKLKQAGLDRRVRVDSAGTIATHAGEPPDPRAQSHALKRGYQLADIRARQVKPADFERFDWLLAMDWDNLEYLKDACPSPHQPKLKRLLEFAPHLGRDVVPDPYYGGPAGFDVVLDLIEAACDGLVAELRGQLVR